MVHASILCVPTLALYVGLFYAARITYNFTVEIKKTKKCKPQNLCEIFASAFLSMKNSYFPQRN